MRRKRFRLVLVVALTLGGGGLVAPTALAALGGPSVAAKPPQQNDGDHDADDKKPQVSGRDHANQHPSDDDDGCFYPPSNRPRVNLYDPNKEFRAPTTIQLIGKVMVGKCDLGGLTVKLFSSRDGGPNKWFEVPGMQVVTDSGGNFRFTGIPFTQTTFYRVTSVPQGGFAAVNSNIIKVKKK